MTKQASANSPLSRKFRKAFEKGLDKLFPEDDGTRVYTLGMQPFQPTTSCQVTMMGAGSYPRLYKPSKSFPNLETSSYSADSSSDSLSN